MKMKTFIVVAVFLGVIAVAVCHSEEQKEKIKKIVEECRTESGATEEALKKAKEENKIEEGSKVPEFLVCFFKKLEFLNDAGELDVEKIKIKLTHKYTEDVAKTLVDECTKDTHPAGIETAIHLGKCLHEKAPKHEHEHED